MRESYIKRVRKALMISRSKKMEVVRDLQEAFTSALGHGETQQQLIERLGTPEEFAAGIHEQFGINEEERSKKKKQFHIAAVCIVALLSLAIGARIHFSKTPDNVIGQANVMTSMRVSGMGLDLSMLFFLFGFFALLVVAILMVKYARKYKI